MPLPLPLPMLLCPLPLTQTSCPPIHYRYPYPYPCSPIYYPYNDLLPSYPLPLPLPLSLVTILDGSLVDSDESVLSDVVHLVARSEQQFANGLG